MKTLLHFLCVIILLNFNAKGQTFYSTFQVRTPETKSVSVPNNYNYTSPTKNHNIIESYEAENTVIEKLITGYYKEGIGNNQKLIPIYLRVHVIFSPQGHETIKVMSYKNFNSNTWTILNYSNVNKVLDDMSSSFTHQVFVNSTLVYFNL